MNKQQPTREQRLAREKAILTYMDAYERGDFDTMSMLLQQAEYDSELGDLIWNVLAAYQAEEEDERRESDVVLVQQLLRQHLSSGWETIPDAANIPPLTVSDVIARIQADEAVKGSVKQELKTVVPQLRQSTVPLPANLGLHGVRALFAQLGLRVSKQLQKAFSETALFLTAGREQGMAHLAATRRQREQSRLREMQQKEQEEQKGEMS
jgi:hypothetical protein